MGKIDTAMNSYLSSKDRFADLFNGALFHGREIIKATDLQDASEKYTAIDNKTFQRFRDIKMYLRTGEALRLLAVENQNQVDYTLPYRCMQYDVMEYGKQIKELQQFNQTHGILKSPAERLCGISKQNRLAPVYTLCLYHGTEPWNGPLALRDMMDFGNDKDTLYHYFSDYPLRLFCVNECKDFSCFHTELKEVFTALAYRKNKIEFKKAISENAAFRMLNAETVQLLSILLNNPKLWNEREKYMNSDQDKEEYNMCQALQEIFDDGISQGYGQGLSQGINLINLLNQKLIDANRLEDLKRAIIDSEYRNQLFQEFHINY